MIDFVTNFVIFFAVTGTVVFIGAIILDMGR